MENNANNNSLPKIIAMYLPQFHCIPENDEFWGKGFTDWVTVRNAQSLYNGHEQPKVPLNNNYYDLSLKNDVEWQAKLAKEYGIYGFGIYHYWFNNDKNLLTKPAEIILNNEEIDINFFFAWDNGNWKRSWSNVAGNDWAPAMEKSKKKSEPAVLIPYILGGKQDWENHYNSLRPYFHDKRYIKKDNKPVFIIFNYDQKISEMCDYWDELAKKDGLNGVFFIFRYKESYNIPSDKYVFRYEPLFSGWSSIPSFSKRLKRKLKKIIGLSASPTIYFYDEIWNKILDNTRNICDKKIYPGAFVAYDDTPRRGSRGVVVKNSTPEKFRSYLSQLISMVQNQKKDFVFLTAWNEWGEGAYLEPDSVYQMNYLKVIKDIYDNE